MNAVGVRHRLDEFDRAPAFDNGRVVCAIARRVLGGPDFLVRLADDIFGTLLELRPGCLVVVDVFSRQDL